MKRASSQYPFHPPNENYQPAQLRQLHQILYPHRREFRELRGCVT